MRRDLARHGSNQTIHFPEEIDAAFKKIFNVRLHAAFTFYVITLVLFGAGVVAGVWYMVMGTWYWMICAGLVAVWSYSISALRFPVVSFLPPLRSLIRLYLLLSNR